MSVALSAGAWLLTHPQTHAVLAAAASASPTPSDPDGSGEDHKAGPWGLGIILLLCIGCFFLFRSMSRQLRKVREEFPKDGYRIDRDGRRIDEPPAPSPSGKSEAETTKSQAETTKPEAETKPGTEPKTT